MKTGSSFHKWYRWLGPKGNSWKSIVRQKPRTLGADLNKMPLREEEGAGLRGSTSMSVETDRLGLVSS